MTRRRTGSPAIKKEYDLEGECGGDEAVVKTRVGDRWRVLAADQVEQKEEGRDTMPRSRIALEIGTHSPWMSRLLSELGHEVIVANATHSSGHLILASFHGVLGSRIFPGICAVRSAVHSR
jgi:hypothetical protein